MLAIAVHSNNYGITKILSWVCCLDTFLFELELLEWNWCFHKFHILIVSIRHSWSSSRYLESVNDEMKTNLTTCNHTKRVDLKTSIATVIVISRLPSTWSHARTNRLRLRSCFPVVMNLESFERVFSRRIHCLFNDLIPSERILSRIRRWRAILRKELMRCFVSAVILIGRRGVPSRSSELKVKSYTQHCRD